MKHTETLKVSRLRGASIFKLIILGSVIGWTLITSVLGIVALFGVEVVQWNGQYVTGVKGLVAAPFIGLFMGALLGLFSAVSTYLGLRFYSLFRGVTLEYVPADDQIKPTTERTAD